MVCLFIYSPKIKEKRKNKKKKKKNKKEKEAIYKCASEIISI